MERAMGIEPTALAWEARVLPLYDARAPPDSSSRFDGRHTIRLSRNHRLVELPIVLAPVSIGLEREWLTTSIGC